MALEALGLVGGHGKGLLVHDLIAHSILVLLTSLFSVTLSEEQEHIDHILLRYSHLDHVLGVPVLADSVMRRRVCRSAANPTSCVARAAGALRDHLFDEVTWPRFTRRPVFTVHSFHAGKDGDSPGGESK